MPCPWVTHTKCSWRPLVLPPDIQREMLFCISKPRPAPSQHAVRAVSKCSGKQPRLIFQPLENKQPISEVIINSFGRGLSNTSCMQRDRFQTRTQKKKRKKGKFSCRADISGVLGTMPPAASTRSHRHSMLSWKRKEPLKNKLLHVKYSRKHTLWGKGRPRRGKTAQNNKGGWKYVRWSPSKGHRQQP